MELYATNHFTPAEYQKIKSRGISFVRGDADNIRHAFIGEDALKKKVQLFTGSAYVYDLAHALLLQIRRTVSQLTNVPEGLDIPTLLAVLFNLRGYKLMLRGRALNGGPPAAPDAGTEAKAEVQLGALSSTDFKGIAEAGGVAIGGNWYTPIRMPDAAAPPANGMVYPWSATAEGGVAVDCVVAQMLEICRSRRIPVDAFSLSQRAGVFTPLELDVTQGRTHQDMLGVAAFGGLQGQADAQAAFGFRNMFAADREGNALPPAYTDPSRPLARDGQYGAGTYQGFPNIIRTIQLPQGQSFGPTSVAGLDEVFRMEQERDSIIAMLTTWGTTGMGLILDRTVPYDRYRLGTAGNNEYGQALTENEAIMGNKPAWSRFSELNGMGDTCGPGYARVWYTGDPANDKSKQVSATINVNGVEYRNPRATTAVCAPVTRQLRSMPFTRDVVTNPVLATAAQRRARRKRKPSAAKRPRRKTATRRRR